MPDPTSETNKPLTPAQILEQVHGCKIIYPEHELPFTSAQELNNAYLGILRQKNIIGEGEGQIREEHVTGFLDGVYDYVNSPIITDPFSKLSKQEDPREVHDLRREWREKLLPLEINRFYQKNKLKSNRIGSCVAMSLITVNEIFEDQLPELELDIRQILEHIFSRITEYSEDKVENTEKYDQLSDEEKISFVLKLDDMIISLMQTMKSIAPQPPTNPASP